MKKLMLMMALIMFFVPTVVGAETFVADGTVTTVVVDTLATITLEGPLAQNAAKVVQYRDFANDNNDWFGEAPFVDGVSVIDASEGNSFQIVDKHGKFVLLTDTMLHNQYYGKLKLKGCTGMMHHPKGWKFYVKPPL